MKLNRKENYYDYLKMHPEYKIVIYGAGSIARSNYKYFGHIDFFCDRNAGNIKNVDNIPCLTPEELSVYKDKMIMLVCIKSRSTVDEVCRTIEKLAIDVEIFDFYDNPAFSRFDFSNYLYKLQKKDKLKIRIVYSEDGWIFGKFAGKLQEYLLKMGQIVDIANVEDPDADVNHYISYGELNQIYHRSKTIRTTMVTHIDCALKRDLIKFQAQNNVVGICMSNDTMNKLSLWGVPRDKLCYINPAHDGMIEPRKIVLGITNRCHGDYDYRKRDNLILGVCEQLEPEVFKLKIMGDGWDKIVLQIRKLGYEVEYYEEFDRELYKELMPSLDYWLYYGFDEGAMGFIDALAAGVKTIATPQGYHLDVKCGLTYPCSTMDDFVSVLKQIQNEKMEIIRSVKSWTWDNYARKHLEVWNYLTGSKSIQELYKYQSEYEDGIFSLLISDNSRV